MKTKGGDRLYIEFAEIVLMEDISAEDRRLHGPEIKEQIRGMVITALKEKRLLRFKMRGG